MTIPTMSKEPVITLEEAERLIEDAYECYLAKHHGPLDTGSEYLLAQPEDEARDANGLFTRVVAVQRPHNILWDLSNNPLLYYIHESVVTKIDKEQARTILEDLRTREADTEGD